MKSIANALVREIFRSAYSKARAGYTEYVVTNGIGPYHVKLAAFQACHARKIQEYSLSQRLAIIRSKK